MYIRGAAMRSLEPNYVPGSGPKSPQPKVSEYAWALCYPPPPWHLLSPIYHICAATFACTAHVHVLSGAG
eukprot:scaffold54950_cov50-Phaeocystis_antarctica.AAC.1